MTSSNRQQEIATPYRRKSPTRVVVYVATMVAVSIVLKLISNKLSVAPPVGKSHCPVRSEIHATAHPSQGPKTAAETYQPKYVRLILSD